MRPELVVHDKARHARSPHHAFDSELPHDDQSSHTLPELADDAAEPQQLPRERLAHGCLALQSFQPRSHNLRPSFSKVVYVARGHGGANHQGANTASPRAVFKPTYRRSRSLGVAMPSQWKRTKVAPRHEAHLPTLTMSLGVATTV
jgi:hypothetical protein